jgi:hypothetical protein
MVMNSDYEHILNKAIVAYFKVVFRKARAGGTRTKIQNTRQKLHC